MMSLIEKELLHLRGLISRMSNLTLKAFDETLKLFDDIDMLERERIRKYVNEVSRILEGFRAEVVNEVLSFIARRQPLGTDLLLAEKLVSITYDFYRISRYLREIVRIDAMLEPKGLNALKDFSKYLQIAYNAVIKVSEDLKNLKPTNKDAISAIDEFIDREYRELLKRMASENCIAGVEALKLLLMRHIERIVDHTMYVVTYLEELKTTD